MAEAHSAVAFGFSVSHEGVNVSYDRELLNEIASSVQRSYKRRVGRFKNQFLSGIYPASPASLIFTLSLLTGLILIGKDPSLGIVPWMQKILFGHTIVGQIAAASLFSVLLWILMIQLIRLLIKSIFTYKGWMYQRQGSASIGCKAFMAFAHLLAKSKPMLYSFQGALPRLPLPSLNDTLNRVRDAYYCGRIGDIKSLRTYCCKHLQSMKPLLNEEKYARMVELTEEFKNTIGPKLQRYLMLKSWFSSNYVTDWWEEYVYLRSRGPLMVNSNYYGLDAVFISHTTNQASRAAVVVSCMLEFRRRLERQEVNPMMIGNVPLCSAQYERMFQTCRIPGIEHDVIRHWADSRHVATYCNGCWWKVPIHNGKRLLTPIELQDSFDFVLHCNEVPSFGEEHLAALTAGERVTWAKARTQYFSTGINKASLDAIERAAFVVILDEEEAAYDPENSEMLDRWSHNCLHGKAYNRWFDKSFNLIISKNAKAGCNAEHSWADAPIVAYLYEWCLCMEPATSKYDKNGRIVGEELSTNPPAPVHLKWHISQECNEVIEESLASAEKLYQDVEMRLMIFNSYGKGFMKKCKISPDGYIQMALQLANYRDLGKFSLTYEASMTRLYREGRTETVRTVSEHSCAFVRSVDDPSFTNEDRIKLLRDACSYHQTNYLNAMCGKGVDRHLFCLFVVSKYLELESPFLKEVIFEPWRLSTSQTPHQQTNLINLNKNPEYVSAGGGFGPVADDGYGVSYIIAGDHSIAFHVSSKKSCQTTSSKRFRENLRQALLDMHNLFTTKYD